MNPPHIRAISNCRILVTISTSIQRACTVTDLSNVCNPSSTSRDLMGKFSFSRMSHISRLSTSFFTLTCAFVLALDVCLDVALSQCCRARLANSFSPSKSSTVGRFEDSAFGRESALLFTRLAGGISNVVIACSERIGACLESVALPHKLDWETLDELVDPRQVQSTSSKLQALTSLAAKHRTVH